MSQRIRPIRMNRRTLLSVTTKAVAAPIAIPAVLRAAIANDADPATNADKSIRGQAGIDRVVVQPGKTYLRGWAGYGEAPKYPTQDPATTIKTSWSKASGPGRVTFANPEAAITTATFTSPGTYVLRLTATEGSARAVSELTVKVEDPAPAQQLQVVQTRRYSIDSPLWNDRFKALIV